MISETMKNTIYLLTITGLLLSGSMITGCSSDAKSNTNTEDAHEQSSEQHSEESGQHAREVKLSQKQQESLGISVEKLSGGSATSTISRPASVGYDLDQIAKVGPRIKAKVVVVQKDLGDRVQEGDPIALMSSVELGKAKAEYIRLKAKLKAERARFEREQSLYEQDISSQAEQLEAEATFQQAKAELNSAAEALRLYGLSQNEVDNIETGSDQPLSYFNLSSPIAGVIQERELSPGQTISSSETPIHVANLSKVWVMIDAYEQDVEYLNDGQNVNITVRSIPNQTFKGTVDWVSYSLQEDSRTMPVRAEINNPNKKLRAGMFGTARIETGQTHKTAMIPTDAVQSMEGEQVVFVPGKESGSFKAVSVVLGDENGGYVEIAAGLQPSVKAVTSGAFDIKSTLTAKSRSASHAH